MKKEKLFNFSLLLLVFTAIVSFFTGAMGGASMPGTRKLPEINTGALHLHALSSFGAIAFLIVLAILAWLRYKKKIQSDVVSNVMMVIIGVLAFAFLVLSMNFASRIRSLL